MKALISALALLMLVTANVHAAKGGVKGPPKKADTTDPVDTTDPGDTTGTTDAARFPNDGFFDDRTPGILCAWEQLNACEGRNEVFVLSETKAANGNRYFYDYEYDLAQQEHVDVCMDEKDAPTSLFIYGLFPVGIDLTSDNGCNSPCNLMLRPMYTNRLGCFENVQLDQSQALLRSYTIDVVRAHTRGEDNFFCHPDFLPPDVSSAECLASSSVYCHRPLQSGETGYEYEDHLDACLTTPWKG